MKKLSILLALLLALSCLLIACDNAPADDGTTTAADTTVTEAPTDEATEASTAAVTDAPSTKVTYTVTVKDQNGDAVVGAAVQMCDDNGCKMPVPTDENGVATFTYDPSNYHITIVECPEGYTADPAQEFYFEDGSYELTAVITKN
ncbi:MAG: Ig-like domain-containing protein [Clostridia bacterium]|nr:Ig-like domain-containing protein [Clostridia bacterium]